MISGLLAQHPQETGLSGMLEQLARASIGSVVLFALACTVIRVGLWLYLSRLDPLSSKLPINRILHVIQDFADALVYAGILVFLIIRPYFVQTFRIPTPSMVPTLREGDMLLVNKLVYRYSDPKAGDIVVFKPPKWALNPWDDPNMDYVKRAIGVPGDIIEIRNSQLFRNGVPENEPFLNEKLFGDFKLIKYNGKIVPLVRDPDGSTLGRSLYYEHVKSDDLIEVWGLPAEPVPKGYYLMMGDNRNQSFDGRYWGLVPRGAIVGKAWWRFWPPGRFGGADNR